MKKVVAIVAGIISIQAVSAHPGAAHSHETILHEWAWIALPAIAALGLVWKYRKQALKAAKK